jgi:hypothetical protein
VVENLRSPIHHGTFQLTDEPIDAPFLALVEALNAAGISRCNIMSEIEG